MPGTQQLSGVDTRRRLKGKTGDASSSDFANSRDIASKKARATSVSDVDIGDIASEMDNLIDLVKMAVTTSNKTTEAMKKFEDKIGKTLPSIEGRVEKIEASTGDLHKKFDDIVELFLKYNNDRENHHEGAQNLNSHVELNDIGDGRKTVEGEFSHLPSTFFDDFASDFDETRGENEEPIHNIVSEDLDENDVTITNNFGRNVNIGGSKQQDIISGKITYVPRDVGGDNVVESASDVARALENCNLFSENLHSLDDYIKKDIMGNSGHCNISVC